MVSVKYFFIWAYYLNWIVPSCTPLRPSNLSLAKQLTLATKTYVDVMCVTPSMKTESPMYYYTALPLPWWPSVPLHLETMFSLCSRLREREWLSTDRKTDHSLHTGNHLRQNNRNRDQFMPSITKQFYVKSQNFRMFPVIVVWQEQTVLTYPYSCASEWGQMSLCLTDTWSSASCFHRLRCPHFIWVWPGNGSI